MVIGRADGFVIHGDYSMFAYDKNFTSPVYTQRLLFVCYYLIGGVLN